MRTSVTFTLFLTTALILLPQSSQGWGNGQSGNAQTDEASECSNPSYSTHDWIADHALALLPAEE